MYCFPDFIELPIFVLWRLAEFLQNNYFEIFIRQFIDLHFRRSVTEDLLCSFSGFIFP